MKVNAHYSKRNDAAIVQAIETLLRMRSDFVAAIHPFLESLADLPGEGIREPTLRRVSMRLYCVLRFHELRHAPDNALETSRSLAQRVCKEARKINPAWKCSAWSLEVWIRAWNRPASDGTPLGWRSLMDPYSERRSMPRLDRRGRRSARSPEAIAFWDKLYLDGDGQSVAACHRLTVAAAKRKGWRWPAGYSTTRYWLGGRKQGRRIKNRRRSRGVWRTIEPRSNSLR